jgi:hypothetical protein
MEQSRAEQDANWRKNLTLYTVDGNHSGIDSGVSRQYMYFYFK